MAFKKNKGKLMKKVFLYGCGIILLIVLGFGWFIITPETLPDSESHLHKKLRNLHMSLLYRYSNDPVMENKVHKSNIPLDIVIPIIEKDIPTARYTIQSIKGLLMHPINKIYIVAPESNKLRKFASDNGLVFINENDVLPKFSGSKTQKGWIKQQYLKLNADSFVEKDNFLVIDADMILMRAHVFIYKGKTIFNVYRDYSLERKKFVQRITGIDKFYNLDFTAHHMLFNKEKLKDFKTHLETKYKKSWFDALNDLDLEDGNFSEYELYANYMLKKYPNKFRFVHGRILNIERNKLEGLNFIQGAYSNEFKAVSSHHFYKL